MKNTAKYAWSFSRNSSFLRGLFYYAAPCIYILQHSVNVGACQLCMSNVSNKTDWLITFATVSSCSDGVCRIFLYSRNRNPALRRPPTSA